MLLYYMYASVLHACFSVICHCNYAFVRYMHAFVRYMHGFVPFAASSMLLIPFVAVFTPSVWFRSTAVADVRHLRMAVHETKEADYCIGAKCGALWGAGAVGAF